MTRVGIKICGLSTIAGIDAALKGGASHVGFMHFAKSPRHVAPEKLAEIAERVPGMCSGSRCWSIPMTCWSTS